MQCRGDYGQQHSVYPVLQMIPNLTLTLKFRHINTKVLTLCALRNYHRTDAPTTSTLADMNFNLAFVVTALLATFAAAQCVRSELLSISSMPGILTPTCSQEAVRLGRAAPANRASAAMKWRSKPNFMPQHCIW